VHEGSEGLRVIERVLLMNGQTESEYSMLLAVPCARDPVEVMTQGHNLRTGFINYLQQKHAAGIVNIQEPGSSQVRHVKKAASLARTHR